MKRAGLVALIMLSGCVEGPDEDRLEDLRARQRAVVDSMWLWVQRQDSAAVGLGGFTYAETVAELRKYDDRLILLDRDIKRILASE